MKEHPVHGQLREAALEAMQKSPLFSALGNADREIVVSHGRIIEYGPNEVLMQAGEASDAFFMILRGRASVWIGAPGQEGSVEISRLEPFDSIGEMGLLLGEARTASVSAQSRLFVLEFEAGGFQLLLDKVGGFTQQLCRILARRLVETSRLVELPSSAPEAAEGPLPEVVQVLPASFIERHQVLPLRIEGAVITVGFVRDPAPHTLSALQRMLPGMEVRPVRVAWAVFDRVLRTSVLKAPSQDTTAPPVGVEAGGSLADAVAAASRSPEEQVAEQRRRLFPLLERMLAEGASDLHLSAGQKPRWRIHGEMHTIADARELGAQEVLELLGPGIPTRAREAYEASRDADFTWVAEGIARFRVNMYEDDNGTSAVLRLIPLTTPTMQQLGLPRAAHELCRLKRGLVIVTGHTGCGKSTTLASMIAHINQTRREHIVTLEDPIEFVHPSAAALVNQREIGLHADSFARALRAALRQDPDIVLVGEMRDLDTVRLALETANTGHLVLATLHTNSAIGAIDRMIDLFPAEERDMARSLVAEVLQAVMTQTLCRRRGGGRIAAFEVLVMDSAIASLIRQGKTHQIATALTTGKARGNQSLNDSLFELARRNLISPEDALLYASDREDMRKRLGGGGSPPSGG